MARTKLRTKDEVYVKATKKGLTLRPDLPEGAVLFRKLDRDQLDALIDVVHGAEERFDYILANVKNGKRTPISPRHTLNQAIRGAIKA